MNHPTSRRGWLQQSTLAFSGLLFAPNWINEFAVPFPTASADMIRLNANENPYAPSPKALQAMKRANELSNRYPWQSTDQLRKLIAKKNDLEIENVIIGAGSSEILGLAMQWAAMEKGNLVMADPTFSIWTRAADQLGLQIVKVPLNTQKVHDLPKMKSNIDVQTRLVYLVNPNNPTGTIVPNQELQDFVMEISKDRLVLLDEAYIEFTEEKSLASLVNDFPNLIVARTFSKLYGLAGARIGYGLAHPDTVAFLNGLQPWKNHSGSAVSIAAARASLEDESFIKMSLQKTAEVRDYLYRELAALSMSFIPSHTNFLYYSTEAYSGDYVKAISDRGFVINRIVEDNGKWTRLTVGTMEEMQQFIKTLQSIL